jgi:hypothetical protein
MASSPPTPPAFQDRLALHAWLHRICSRRTGLLKDCLREPVPPDRLAAIEQQAICWLPDCGWDETFAGHYAEAATRGEIAATVFCGGVLMIHSALPI